ncbi:alpha/beta hydrolase [Oceanomicrobium pacificus]|uniref:Alpha/beta fold hydrolase n=1 Tax=Oceanomicrobium pacificus TaxID=2692916 RepID=A0A6B0TUX1_9RHOB|nr:alpha/beta hydrolase [Oceanomicrobium pacificus]MXU65565.1 alpha/beta fold hydrolase [Oceanomicrobium pacificus]
MGTRGELTSSRGQALAFCKTEARGKGENLPGLVFLGGFRSDMEGSKALFLENWAAERGRAFLRFDYSGHGASGGDFLDGSIGDWAADAREVIAAQTDGPQILIGSSMGGWISLLVARDDPDRVAGLVGIAAAPDFTEDSMWAGFDDAMRKTLLEEGQVALPSDYSDDPYIITRKLIEEGRTQLVLRDPLPLPMPVRLLHGTADADVAMSVPLRILDHAKAPDLRLTFVKGADHRMSGPAELALIGKTVHGVTQAVLER